MSTISNLLPSRLLLIHYFIIVSSFFLSSSGCHKLAMFKESKNEETERWGLPAPYALTNGTLSSSGCHKLAMFKERNRVMGLASIIVPCSCSSWGDIACPVNEENVLGVWPIRIRVSARRPPTTEGRVS